MATGDQSDFVSRLKALMPARWFNDSNPILDAVLNGLAQALAWVYSLYLYAVMQTRILTATGGWLDLIAYDFFGDRVKREASQSDADFLNVIRTNMFRERGTRQSVISALEDLTGITPDIIEPMRPMDVGAYGAAVAVSRSTTATYVDLNGILRTTQPNQARYDANPYATAMNGLMIERVSTNLVPMAINFAAAGWTKVRVAVTDYATTGPDGNLSASFVVPTTDNNNHQIASATISCSGNANYEYSVYVKGGGYTQLRLRSADSVAFIRDCVFDTSTGAFITGANIATATQLSNGWWRLSFNMTTSAAATYLTFGIWVYSGGSATFSGDGSSGLYVFGGQVESGDSLTSFIPTYASAVTRSADTLLTNMPTGSTFNGGYGIDGAYGSMLMPYQAFVTAYRPVGVGVPYVAGYGSTPSGYSIPSRGEYAPAANLATLTDAQIYAAIASVKMEGTAVWVRILPSTSK